LSFTVFMRLHESIIFLARLSNEIKTSPIGVHIGRATCCYCNYRNSDRHVVAGRAASTPHMAFPTSGSNGADRWWTNVVQLGSSYLTGPGGGSPSWSSEPAGWLWQIAPFIEQNNLVSQREPGIYQINSVTNLMPAEQQIPVASCPSRGQTIFTHGLRLLALSDYASVGGHPRAPNSNPVTLSGPEWFNSLDWHSGVIRPAGGTPHNNNSGETLWKFPKMGFSNITDGSSNTALLIEKASDARLYSPVVNGFPVWRYRGVLGGQFAPGYGTNTRHIGPFNPDNATQITLPWGVVIDRPAPDAIFNGWPYLEITFGSAHPGTVSAVFADGSTHSLSMNTDHQVCDDIGMPTDGHVVDHGAF